MKVAIVGGAPRSKHLAPFDDEDWEIWVIGNQLDQYEGKRISKIFEIHNEFSRMTEGYEQWIVDKNVDLIVSDKFPIKVGHTTIFPFEDALKLIGEHFTSTVSYMMAYAILKGATHISIYGVDMDVAEDEYYYQRPALYAWIGYAKGIGIEVSVPESSLLKERRYPDGYVNISGPFSKYEFMKMSDLHASKMDQIKIEIQNLDQLYKTHHGCKQAYDRMSLVARALESGIEINSLQDSTTIKE